MVPKCADLSKLVTAIVTLCNAHTFKAKVDVEGNERGENLPEKNQKLPETVLII
jgi:hypothetical protein